MSNDVYGYIEPALSLNVKNNLSHYMRSHKLGIQEISKSELYNYPVEYFPENNIFCFQIGDAPGCLNAEVLIGYNQYDPEDLDLYLPANPKDKIDLLLDLMINMIVITKAKRLVIAMTLCSQIETIKRVNFSEMRDVIHADFEKHQSPTDTLYEIIIEN